MEMQKNATITQKEVVDYVKKKKALDGESTEQSCQEGLYVYKR